jgi:hypothetical protein
LQPGFALQPLRPIPDSWWITTGAVFAYLYGNLAARGIDALDAAELIDYPGQFAATTLLDRNAGTPNARYWVAKLLHDMFGPGERLTAAPKGLSDVQQVTRIDPAYQVYAQGFASATGQRRILLVNKRAHALALLIPGAAGGAQQTVAKESTSPGVPATLTSDRVRLPPSAVAVITMPVQSRTQ